MNESNFSSEEQEVLKGYVNRIQEGLVDKLIDFRFSQTDEAVELLHSDAHWIPKAGCNVPDGKTIMNLDNRDKDEVRNYLMVLVCKEIIGHCEETIFHLQND